MWNAISARLKTHFRLRAEAKEALEAEARGLVAAKTTSGALWHLRELEASAKGDRAELRRIDAIRNIVLRGRGVRHDTATRMHYRDL